MIDEYTVIDPYWPYVKACLITLAVISPFILFATLDAITEWRKGKTVSRDDMNA